MLQTDCLLLGLGTSRNIFRNSTICTGDNEYEIHTSTCDSTNGNVGTVMTPSSAPSIFPPMSDTKEICIADTGYTGGHPTIESTMAPNTMYPTESPTIRSTVLMMLSVEFTLNGVWTTSIVNESSGHIAMSEYVCNLLSIPIASCMCGINCLTVSELETPINQTVSNVDTILQSMHPSTSNIPQNKDREIIVHQHRKTQEWGTFAPYLLHVNVNVSLNTIDIISSYTNPPNISTIITIIEERLDGSTTTNAFLTLFWSLLLNRYDLFFIDSHVVQGPSATLHSIVGAPTLGTSIDISPTISPTSLSSNILESNNDNFDLNTTEIVGLSISIIVLFCFQCVALLLCCFRTDNSNWFVQNICCDKKNVSIVPDNNYP